MKFSERVFMKRLAAGLVAFLFVLSMHPVSAQQTVPQSYPLTNSVTLDGRYTTPNEWNDTSELQLDVGATTGAAYFSSKYDSNYLYTIWDFVECRTYFAGNKTNSPNQVVMNLDPSDRGVLDDSLYAIAVVAVGSSSVGTPFAGSVSVSRGTSNGWTKWGPQPSTNPISTEIQYTSSPHSSASHLVVEVRIDLTFADLKSHLSSSRIGYSMVMHDFWTNAHPAYPSHYDINTPSSWGWLDFMQVPIPEFDVIAVPLIMSLLVAALVTRRRHKRP